MSAITLLEAMKQAQGRGEMLEAGVYATYLESQLFQYLKFQEIPGNSLSFLQEDVLGMATFRAINEGYATSYSKTHRVTEVLSIMGGDIDVDVATVNMTPGIDIRASEVTSKIRAMSMNAQEAVIKSSVADDPKAFNGLQVRLTGSQLIAAGSTSGGDALSLFKLDQAIKAVVNPTAIICNTTMSIRLSQASRNTSVGGFITYGQDEFGKQLTMYNGLPIVEMRENSIGDDILPFDEAAPAGGTAQCTSIYVVSLAEDGVVMLQNGKMRVRDLGELNDMPVFRTRIEWYTALAMKRRRCASRIWGITNATVAV